MPSEIHKPSPELARIVGSTPLSWVKIMELVRDYIVEHGLEGPPPYIETDDALRAIVGDRNKVSAYELTRSVKKHISPA